MLPKDISSSRRPRVAQNSSVLSIQRRKNISTQTSKFGPTESSNNFIAIDGKISKYDQINYRTAIDFVNNWNNAMNQYLKKRTNNKRVFDFDEEFNITPIPNYMSFFVAVQELESRYRNTSKPITKNSYSQTRFLHEKMSVDVKSQTQYVKSKETIEDQNDVENIPKKIQEAQYSTYSHRTKHLHNSQKNQNANHCPPLKRSARFSESNIRQTSSNIVDKDSTGYSPKPRPMNVCHTSPVRQNQSFANFSSTTPGVGRRNRPITGLLSPNGMIASEINANGTPITVRDMFEKVQNPLGVFVSQGNILKNISRSGSSSSSVILSDKESGQLKFDKSSDEKDDIERTSSPYCKEEGGYDGGGYNCRGGKSSGCEEEDPSIKHHPLNLNERDLNSKDKNFISSIGIFTEAGELKPNAKTYLETKEDVRKGTFRAPRLSQLHMTKHYNVKSCTSGSLLSDIVSTRSSEIDE